MIKVVIADDHDAVRDGLRSILDMEDDIQIVGEACNGKEALELAAGCDVLLLDIEMPDMDGLEALKRLKAEPTGPKPKVLILSIHDEGNYVARAIQHGAAGYLTKDCAVEHLVAAIRQAAAGGKWVCPSFIQRVVSASEEESRCGEGLTKREIQVLRLMSLGKTSPQIAERLGLSPKTVNGYRSRIRQKLHLQKPADALRYAIDHGLFH